jgi:hypothetical protein
MAILEFIFNYIIPIILCLGMVEFGIKATRDANKIDEEYKRHKNRFKQ